MAWFHQFCRWISNLCFVIWNVLSKGTSFITRPFKQSPSMELPIASPALPSTPSFIQAFEPNLAMDAMKIFQLAYGSPRASRIARNKLALQDEQRSGGINNYSSVERESSSPALGTYVIDISAMPSSEDSSPGRSVLSDVDGTLAPSVAAHSLSVYSTPPSSPSSTLNVLIVPDTPDIGSRGMLSMGEANTKISYSILEGEERFTTTECEPQLDVNKITKSEATFAPDLKPGIGELAKRRGFRGTPIVTTIPNEPLFLPLQPSIPGVENLPVTSDDLSPTSPTPKSALSTLTEFVRASTTPKSSKAAKHRETTMISPVPQPIYDDEELFATHGDSFYADENLALPFSSVDILDIDVYTASESAADVSTPRLRRQASHFDLKDLASPIAMYPRGTYVYDRAVTSLAQNFKSTQHKSVSPRMPVASSAIQDSAITSIASAIEEETASVSYPPSGIVDDPSSTAVAEVLHAPSILPNDLHAFDIPSPRLSPSSKRTTWSPYARQTSLSIVVEEEELKRISTRLSAYASMIFPFSLVDDPFASDESDCNLANDSNDSEEDLEPRRRSRQPSFIQELPSCEEGSVVHATAELVKDVSDSNASLSVVLEVRTAANAPSIKASPCRDSDTTLSDPALIDEPVATGLGIVSVQDKILCGGQDDVSADDLIPAHRDSSFIQSSMPFLVNVAQSLAASDDYIPDFNISTTTIHVKNSNRKKNRCATIMQAADLSGFIVGAYKPDSDIAIQAPESWDHPSYEEPQKEACNVVELSSTAADSPSLQDSIPTSRTSWLDFPASGFTSTVSGRSFSVGVSEPTSSVTAITDDTSFSGSEDISGKDDKSEGDVPDAQDGQYDATSRGKVRARRVGMYGGLPRRGISASTPLFAPPKCLDSVAARNRSIAAERHRASIIYSSQRDSKRGSSLRPLMLPLRLALRDTMTSGVSGESSKAVSDHLSTSSSQTNVTNIGRPPPFPLPALPPRALPSIRKPAPQTRTKRKPVNHRLNALVALMDAVDGASIPEPDSVGSTPSTPSSSFESDPESGLCDDPPAPRQAVNWGIAF